MCSFLDFISMPHIYLYSHYKEERQMIHLGPSVTFPESSQPQMLPITQAFLSKATPCSKLLFGYCTCATTT